MDDHFQELVTSENSDSVSASESADELIHQKLIESLPTDSGKSAPRISLPEEQDDWKDVSEVGWKAMLSNSEMQLVTTDCSGDDVWTGRRIGDHERYLVREQIGTGGMGIVYLALDQKLNHAPVAIKVPRRKYLIPGLQERFEREFHVMSELSHPSICRITDTGTHDGLPFAVLQYLPGGNLKQRFFGNSKEHPRNAETLFEWLPSIAAALTFIHQRNYIHRDIKPENILFDAHGAAYISDFGIVRLIDATRASAVDSSLTQFGSWVGTPGYVAPEVLTGKGPEITGQADLYALAGVVYLFLTGQQPFPGKDPHEVRNAQLQGNVTPAHRLNKQLPESVSAVLEKALSTRPELRQQDCDELLNDLSAALNSHGVTPRKTRALPSIASMFSNIRLKKPSRRVFGVAAPATLLLCGLAYFLYHQWEPEPNPTPHESHLPPIDQERFANNMGEGQVYLGHGEADEALQNFTRAIAINDSDPEAYIGRGKALLALGEYAPAEIEFTEAIKRNRQPAYLAERGQIRLILKNYAGCIEDYSAALEMAAGQDFAPAILASWHNHCAAAQTRQGQFEAALKNTDVAIQFQPDEPAHYRNRGHLHQRLGNEAMARADLDKARSLQSP